MFLSVLFLLQLIKCKTMFDLFFFLGLALGPNKASEVTTDHPFRLTMAALEIDDGKINSKRQSFYI